MPGLKTCISPNADSEEDTIVIAILMTQLRARWTTLIPVENTQKQPQKKHSYGNP